MQTSRPSKTSVTICQPDLNFYLIKPYICEISGAASGVARFFFFFFAGVFRRVD
jgi:hypothetical protein